MEQKIIANMTTTSKILSGIIVVLVLACGFFFFTAKAPTKLGSVYGTPAFDDYADATLATTTLATFGGILHTIVITNPVSNSVINVYDAASTSTAVTPIATITIPSSSTQTPFTLTFDNINVNGLTISQATATSTLTAEY
jgi:hypothetical protein